MGFKYVTILRLLTTVLALTTVSGLEDEQVHAGSCCGGGSSPPARNTTVADSSMRPMEPPFVAPHGGQLSRTIWNYYEVVYAPLETRIYVYDMFRAPIRVHGIQGKAQMRVKSSGEAFSYPLRYEQVPNEQDYLAMKVDLTRVRSGDMEVDFEMGNLPNKSAPSERFTQVYGDPGPKVPVFAQHSSEHNALAAVQPEMSCCNSAGVSAKAVTNNEWSGNSAKPDCCRWNAHGVERSRQTSSDLVAGAHSDGEALVPRIPPANGWEDPAGASRAAPRVVVVSATPVDEAAIRLQGMCPVLNQPLGGHGPPTKLLIDGRALFVCCQGCVQKVKESPDKYLAMVARQM